ncbi:MAG: type II secretion system protein [Bdellovibrionota bacterium]
MQLKSLRSNGISDDCRGTTLVEMLVVFAIVGILSSSAISNLAQIKNPLKDGISQALGFVKEVRAKALSTTSAYTVRPSTTGRLVTTTGKTCSDAAPATAGLSLDLPSGAALTDITWSICFNSRGLTEGASSFSIQNADGETETIEIFLGGAARIQP